MCSGLLSEVAAAELGKVLGANFAVDLADGSIHLCFYPLPSGTPAAVAVVDGELWVVMDGDQPLARRHARALLREYADQLHLAQEVEPSRRQIFGAIPIPRQPVRLGFVN